MKDELNAESVVHPTSVSKRKSVTKKTRFEVFKRDSFTCQYCGRKAPDVLLVVDHIEPVAKGGTNDFLNLITACAECNSGKSDRRLDDTTVLDVQRQQLEELQQRREQIEMIFQWRQGLLELDNEIIARLSAWWSKLVRGFRLNENGVKGLKRLVKKFEVGEITVAMQIAADQYLEYDENGPTQDAVEIAWEKVGGICRNRRRQKDQPNERRLYYVRGILNNRLDYLDADLAIHLLQRAHTAGATLESLELHAKTVTSWTDWRRDIESFGSAQDDVSEDCNMPGDCLGTVT